jgi:zinc protease
VAGLDAITLDDVRTFARTWYTRANLRVALAGDAGPEVLAGLQAVLAALPVGTPPAPTAVTARRPKGPEATIVEKDTRGVAISIGRPVEVRRGHPDFLALWVARTWLGEHRSSMARLYQQIREARGMNYGDYAYLEAFPRGMFQFFPDTNIARRAQLFELWLRPVKPEHAQLAIRLALHELRTLIERGLTAAEFDAVRGYLVKNAPIAVAQSAAQAGAALDAQWFDVAPWPRYVREGLARLTVEDVNRAMKAHLSSTDVVIVAVAKDARGLAAALVADAPSRVAYDSEKPKAVLDEDAVIGAEKLGLSAEAVTVVPVEAIFAR